MRDVEIPIPHHPRNVTDEPLRRVCALEAAVLVGEMLPKLSRRDPRYDPPIAGLRSRGRSWAPRSSAVAVARKRSRFTSLAYPTPNSHSAHRLGHRCLTNLDQFRIHPSGPARRVASRAQTAETMLNRSRPSSRVSPDGLPKSGRFGSFQLH